MIRTILMTGGTGMIGQALTKKLVEKGYRVIILTRRPQTGTVHENISYALWNIEKQEIDVQAVQQADIIIHLAGAGVMERKWTAAWKKEIVESRTLSSKLIVNTLQQHPHSIKAVISASAIGWYGPDPFLPTGKESEGFNEEAKPDGHFLGETCRLWEESIEPVTAMGIRLVRFRTGIVLSNEGGAFPEFKKTLRNGIAAVLGNGKQVISWIHLEDLCRLYLYAIENEIPGGPYNVVAPAPVTNKTFILKLAGAMRGRFFIPLNVPVFLLKLILGKRSIEVLKSATVSAGRIKETGFVFLYPSIDAALKELIPKK